MLESVASVDRGVKLGCAKASGWGRGGSRVSASDHVSQDLLRRSSDVLFASADHRRYRRKAGGNQPCETAAASLAKEAPVPRFSRHEKKRARQIAEVTQSRYTFDADTGKQLWRKDESPQ